MIKANVIESEEAVEKINSININYMQLMADCVKNENLRADFLKTPHPYLRKVGMTIPDNVQVVLDDDDVRWPVIEVNSNGKKIKVTESKLKLEIMNMLESGKTEQEYKELANPAEISMDMNIDLDEADVVVKLPFFDAKADLLGVFNFSDDTEVILSCC